MEYKKVPCGYPPYFEIRVRLCEGADIGARTHSIDEVIRIIKDHTKSYIDSMLDVVVGSLTLATAVQYSKTGEMTHRSVAIYSGYADSIHDHRRIVDFLSNLAGKLGKELNQSVVYVVFDDEQWIMERVEVTATSEAVGGK